MTKAPRYLELYDTLSNAADKLENMEEPDVDMVLPLVNSGVEAFKVCLERIKQVRAQIEEIKI